MAAITSGVRGSVRSAPGTAKEGITASKVTDPTPSTCERSREQAGHKGEVCVKNKKQLAR